jgi:hypothetical protein
VVSLDVDHKKPVKRHASKIEWDGPELKEVDEDLWICCMDVCEHFFLKFQYYFEEVKFQYYFEEVKF